MLADKWASMSLPRMSQKNQWLPKAAMTQLSANGVIEKPIIVKTAPLPFARLIARGMYKRNHALLKLHKAGRFTSHLAQVATELTVLRLLSKHNTPKNRVQFPRIYHTNATATEVYGVRQYFTGTQLLKHPEKAVEAYDACVTALSTISTRLSRHERSLLPKRTPFAMLLTFPFLAVIALLKNRAERTYIQAMIVLFIKHVSLRDILQPDYVLAHRDLSPENILIMQDKFGVIDAEVAALCEKGTDLALFPRFYHRFIALEGILKLLQNHIRTPRERAAFIRLTTYYTVHYLAICATTDAYYQEARSYTKFFVTKLIPMLRVAGGSLYERVLRFLLVLPLRIGFSPSSFYPTKDFILCYHSIAPESTRYTTSPQHFDTQLAYLTTHTTIVPLATLLAGYPKAKGVRTAITFDDGYQDTYLTALPAVGAHNATATVFVIGNMMKSNSARTRYINKPMMTSGELRALAKKGWEIGFHTQSHQDLRLVPDEKLSNEMIGAKAHIEKEIGSMIRYIAYPFGGYTAAVQQFLPIAGYEAGFTTDAGAYSGATLSAIPRVDVEGSLTDTEFAMLCSSYGLRISGLLMRLLTGKIYIEQLFKRIYPNSL